MTNIIIINSEASPHAWRDSCPMEESLPLWWCGYQLTREGQRPDLLEEFFERWDHWRANGLTIAEANEMLAWFESHAAIDIDAQTLQAYEPC